MASLVNVDSPVAVGRRDEQRNEIIIKSADPIGHRSNLHKTSTVDLKELAKILNDGGATIKTMAGAKVDGEAVSHGMKQNTHVKSVNSTTFLNAVMQEASTEPDPAKRSALKSLASGVNKYLNDRIQAIPSAPTQNARAK